MLTSEIIRRVREIQIRTGRPVADVLAGEYVSVFRGTGIEFEEVRPYLPGDDVRSIDWNVTARAGAPYVKSYVEERQLRLMLLADVSSSQDFGSASHSKREATAELCALLGFAAIRNNDKVGLLLFHREVEQYIPPRKGQRHALRVVREVLAHESGAEANARAAGGRLSSLRARLRGGPRQRRRGTDLVRALEYLLQVEKRRSLCFIVSDFIDAGYERTLSMASRRHEVVAVLVTDPREQALPASGLVTLEDAETGRRTLCDTGAPALRRAVATQAADRLAGLERRLRQRGIDLVQVDASGSVADPLVAYFRRRERRLRR